MKTKLLMTTSAFFLGILGILLSFFPKEILENLNIDANLVTILILQLQGALYLGFAILNWMARGTIIGGIYNRPIAIGNFMHFIVGAITLVKIVSSIQIHREVIIGITVLYVIFALLFAYVFRTNPAKT